jgi:hypothetical protein
VFIDIPGVVDRPPPKPKPKYVPRFEVVTGEGKKVHVLVKWGKWRVVQARIPALLAKGYAVRIRRKMIRNPEA